MEALVALLGEVQAFKYDSGGFKNVVLTITGFYGGERELVKQLALHCRVRYEPSLVKGWTTHLVCNATTTVHRSEKLVRAAEWGIPAVNLQWFADSILEGGPLPVDEYAVQLPKPAVEGRAVPREPGTLQQNVVRWPHQPVRRPSSAASNEPTEAAAAAAAAPPPPAGRTERIQNSPAQDPVARPALCALENVMAQLQGVSISPKPQLTAAARKRPYDQREEVPEESSLVVIHAGSPNHSESLQHLVCVASPTTSPVSSRLEPRAGPSFPSPVANASPMLASPCTHQTGQQQEGLAAASSPGGCTPASSAPSSDGRGSLTSVSDFSMGSGSCESPSPEIWTGSSPGQSLGGRSLRSSPPTSLRWANLPSPTSPASSARPDSLPARASVHTSADSGYAKGSRSVGDESPGLSSLSSSLMPTPASMTVGLSSPAISLENQQARPVHSAADYLSQPGSSFTLAHRAAIGRPKAPAAVGSPASSVPLHQPPSNDCHITSRRPTQQQPGRQHIPSSAAQEANTAATGGPKCITEWTDDDESEGFPTPNEQRRRPSMEDVRPAVIARPAPAPTVQLGDSVALKLLKAAPRGNCVREHHGLSTLKGVQFAEQVQVAKAGLLLSSKEKRTAVRLQAKSVGGPVADDHQSSRLEVLGEPQTFYRLADGIWYLEYCQLYTAGQAEELAAEQGIHLALPAGFDRHNELLKSTARQFAALEDVLGGVTVRRVKQGGTMLKLKGAATGTPSYFWRTALDPTTLQCLTDRPAKDFVASEGLQL